MGKSSVPLEMLISNVEFANVVGLNLSPSLAKVLNATDSKKDLLRQRCLAALSSVQTVL